MFPSANLIALHYNIIKSSKLRGDLDKKLEFGHSDRLKNFHCVRMIRKATAI